VDLFLITNCAPARHHYEKTKKQKTKLKNFFFFSFGCVYVCGMCVTLFPPILYSYIYYTYLPAPQPAIFI
jgi:hypothetical protein